jgi:hypothetical protein
VRSLPLLVDVVEDLAEEEPVEGEAVVVVVEEEAVRLDTADVVDAPVEELVRPDVTDAAAAVT